MSEIIVGDSLEVLRGMDAESVDSIVTDPPYGLSFMGNVWDGSVPGVELWAQCLRVLKPGGHLLAFAGTRTQHRMAAAIEDAGFEIRDMIAWVYGSGFPKSHNLRDEWQGWGTALKPALEPITVARKPMAGTVVENVLAHGTGALHIDRCRIKVEGEVIHEPQSDPHKRGSGAGEYCVPTRDTEVMHAAQRASVARTMELGRWPSNLIHDGSDEVVEAFPLGSFNKPVVRQSDVTSVVYGAGFGKADRGSVRSAFGDTGSAARFFYCAKASKAERGPGNNHPTVKPLALMRYLCRLVTPPGGLVLDPFAGSGTTIVAALAEGFRAQGIELNPEYAQIARRRLASVPMALDFEGAR